MLHVADDADDDAGAGAADDLLPLRAECRC